MTTGRPRLESSPAGRRAIDEARAILRQLPEITLSSLGYLLRKRRVERPGGGLDWNEKAVKRLVDRAKAIESSE